MSRRWSLIIAYALATLVAPGQHDHGGGDHRAPEAVAGCGGGGVHLANHPDAPDLSFDPLSCPACQHRSDHQAFLAAAADNRPVERETLGIEGGPGTGRRPVLRASIRAPPLA